MGEGGQGGRGGACTGASVERDGRRIREAARRALRNDKDGGIHSGHTSISTHIFPLYCVSLCCFRLE